MAAISVLLWLFSMCLLAFNCSPSGWEDSMGNDVGEAPNLDSNKFAIVIFVNCFIYFPDASCSAIRYRPNGWMDERGK